MGFYGNTQGTNRTAFSYDLIYATRKQMDEACGKDNVFLGRYVLVEYDVLPVMAYFDFENTPLKAYRNQPFNSFNLIERPATNVLYQVANPVDNGSLFYAFENGAWKPLNAISSSQIDKLSPYAISYYEDVQKYGRGYDSTVWMKSWETETNQYKYVQVAELNTVVPRFHLMNEAPTEALTTPWFDKLSTDLDYYLRMQAPYGFRIKRAWDPDDTTKIYPAQNTVQSNKFLPSDETFSPDTFAYNKNQIWEKTGQEANAPADIYYNKAGFDAKVETLSDMPNSINYELTASGRRYNVSSDELISKGITNPDTYDFYIHLPAIGNAIAEFWNKIYGKGINEGGRRNINDAQQRDDTADHLVTYDKNTFIGLMNVYRDLLGYAFVEKKSTTAETISMADANSENAVELTYTDAAAAIAHYKKISTIYYEDKDGVRQYYYYTRVPIYEQYSSTTSASSIPDDVDVYYKDDDGVYHLARKTLLGYKDSDGELHSPDISTLYHYVGDNWKLTPLDQEFDDNYYGMLIKLHRLIGTGNEDICDTETLYGCINRINDILEQVENRLTPGRLLITDPESGKITTTETYFPAAPKDETDVLQGDGKWVSRFASVKIVDTTTGSSESAIGTQAGSEKILQADNGDSDPTSATGTAVNAQHNPDQFIINSQNQWIQLSANTTTDAVTFGHKLSPVTSSKTLNGTRRTTTANRANVYRYGLNADKDVVTLDTTNTNEAANTFNVPYFEVDMAGHITAAETHTVTLPENFSAFTFTNNDTADTETITATAANKGATVKHTNDINATTVTANADSLTDTFAFKTGNKWIRFSDYSGAKNGPADNNKDTDTITLYHEIHQILHTTSNSDLNDNQTATQSFTTQTVEWDGAGHITHTDTHTYALPDFFQIVRIADANNTGNAYGQTATTDVDLVANKTFDILSIGPDNDWIRLHSGDDNFTIAHSLSKLTAHNFATTAGTANNADYLETKTTSGLYKKTIRIPLLETDNAGHVIGYSSKSFDIPGAFNTITLNKQSDAVTNEFAGSSSNQSAIADEENNTFIFATGNKWITAKMDGDKITFAHAVSAQTAYDFASSYKDTPTAATTAAAAYKTITIPTFSTDNAGHVVGKGTQAFTIPYTYNKITLAAQSSAVADMTTSNGSQVADEQADTFTFATGNKWITAAITDDKITFAHAVPGLTGLTAGAAFNSAAQTPAFGATFNIPVFTFDAAGHVTKGETTKVTIPEPSYVPDTNFSTGKDSVLTALGFTSSTGKLTSTKTYLANMILTNYGNDTTHIKATDTLKDALKYLDNAIDTEIENRTSAINQEITNRNTAISTAIDNEVTNRNAAISTAIDNLDANYTITNNPLNLSLKQENGKITEFTGSITNDYFALHDHTHTQYLTAHQSLSNYYTKSEVDAAIKAMLIDLKEVNPDLVIPDKYQ